MRGKEELTRKREEKNQKQIGPQLKVDRQKKEDRIGERREIERQKKGNINRFRIY